MAVFATRAFRRFAEKAALEPAHLMEAALSVMSGRPHADLGGGVYKQRVRRPGGGKSGGVRTLLVFRRGSHCFLVHGFAKNEKDNITARELQALKKLGEVLLGIDESSIGRALSAGDITEVREADGQEDA